AGALIDPLLYHFLYLVELHFGGQWTDVVAVLVGRIDRQRFRNRFCDFHSLVIFRPLHQHARRRIAALAGIVETMGRAAPHGIGIGILEDDVGALTAEF